MTIASNGDFHAYSFVNGRKGSLIGHGGSSSMRDQSLCVFVPSMHSQVVIISNGKEQVVSQNTQIRVSTSIGDHTEVYSKRHVAWYRHDSGHWLSESYNNMTGFVRDQKLLSLERKVLSIRRMYISFSWYFIALIVLLVWSSVLSFVVWRLVCKKGCCGGAQTDEEGPKKESNTEREKKVIRPEEPKQDSPTEQLPDEKIQLIDKRIQQLTILLEQRRSPLIPPKQPGRMKRVAADFRKSFRQLQPKTEPPVTFVKGVGDDLSVDAEESMDQDRVSVQSNVHLVQKSKEQMKRPEDYEI